MVERLIKIHNELMLVEVKGESVLSLGNCIFELRKICEELNKKQMEEQKGDIK